MSIYRGGIFIHHYLKNIPGENSWKRYLLSFFVMLAALIAGSIIYAVISVAISIAETGTVSFDEVSGSFAGTDPTLDLLLLNMTYVSWLLGIWFSMRVIHKRKLRTLITAGTINWRQIFAGFGIFFGLMVLVQFLSWAADPGSLPLNDITFRDFLFLFLVVLFLTPVQTTVEELFFRGFLLQWFAKLTVNPVILALIMGVIFGSMHFMNPEMGRSALWVGLDYVFVGFMLTFLAVKMGSSELSIGAHAANNMFLFWFFSDEQSVGGSLPAIFTVTDVNPPLSLAVDVILFTVFYLVVRRVFRNKELKI